MNTLRYEASYEYNDDVLGRGILYDNDHYIEWTKIADTYCALGVIHTTDMSPYFLVSEILRGKIYISDNSIQDLLPPYSYFSFCGESNDFIFESPDDTSLNLLYVKEGFVFPNIYKNEVDEVWMSLSPFDNGNITDEITVKTIVDCAKSKTKKELDTKLYDYIFEKSWDNYHVYVKYSGYPLVEEFFVIRTKDGRCVVEQ